MSVETRHPHLTQSRLQEWALIHDAIQGEATIKLAGSRYLPMPSGFAGEHQEAMYDAYKERAEFPEIVAPSLSTMTGIIHEQEIEIELPSRLEYLRERATDQNETLDTFQKRITRHLLGIGRYAVLADAPEGGGDVYLSGFCGDRVINWDDDFFVLDDCGYERQGFTWEQVTKYRVFELDEGRYKVTTYSGQAKSLVPTDMTPTGTGNRALDHVPFYVANSIDPTAEIKPPPMIGVAQSAKAMYQLSADYRHQLFMSGQETLVAINGDAPTSVGAGVVHSMKGSEGVTPDLKYVSPTCNGIAAHKVAIEDRQKQAIAAGARLFQTESTAQESGEARSMRFSAETATLRTVVQSSCAVLERALKSAAIMQGANENDVAVIPPKDLLDRTIEPAAAAALFGIYQGGGMSFETFYENLQRGGIASNERDADAEQNLIDDQEFQPESDALIQPVDNAA